MQKQEGKKFTSSLLFTGGVSILVGIIIFLIPIPQSLRDVAELVPARNAELGWRLLAIFVATIVALILKPFPMGTVCFISIAVLAVTKTTTVGVALSGFSNTTIWLIVCAFFISRGFVKTGLGQRIAYLFMKAFGKKTLGLSYSFIISDLVMAPAMPSNTARAGGIIYPIIRSLANVFGSKVEDGTERKVGSYLLYTTFQADNVVSAMFMTAMAANPLAAQIASDVLGLQISWMQWAVAAFVPGIVSLALLPLLMYKIYPPEIKETPEATEIAKKKLQEMGPLSKKEKQMIFVFFLILVLWIFGPNFRIDATTTALIGLCTMLLIGILDFNDIKTEQSAWDTLVWFAALVMMAAQLNTLGVIPWFSVTVTNSVSGLGWVVAFAIIALAYFYSHYFFASATAHVSAMYGALLLASVSLGAPPLFAALVLAFFSNLFMGLTHYGTGPAPVYFGSGYVTQGTWWGYAFLISVINIAIWVLVGGLWWRILGLW
ncbi:MAG: anion permease [Treponema sp.]|nr:anion permease [Treponema sp.]